MEEAVSTTIELCKSAKAALGELSRLTPEKTNEALLAMADSLVKNTESILLSNREDCERARESISPVMLDRLKLKVCNGIRPSFMVTERAISAPPTRPEI